MRIKVKPTELGYPLSTRLENFIKDLPNTIDLHKSKEPEWTDEIIKDFLSDFVNITDDQSVINKMREVYHDKIADGWNERDAENFADGYERALLDILNNTK
jgi:hypothetical protein